MVFACFEAPTYILFSTNSNALLRPGSEKKFNECLGVRRRKSFAYRAANNWNRLPLFVASVTEQCTSKQLVDSYIYSFIFPSIKSSPQNGLFWYFVPSLSVNKYINYRHQASNSTASRKYHHSLKTVHRQVKMWALINPYNNADFIGMRNVVEHGASLSMETARQCSIGEAFLSNVIP